jgi:hypothetical protein
VLTSPATWFALLVVGLGFGLFWLIGRKPALSEGPVWFKLLTESSFGFEPLNHAVVATLNAIAERLRATQTGALNWNMVGIVGALLALLLILGWSVA